MSEIIRIAEQAHMAGQYNAGVDPSYSEARAYCSGLELPNVDELKAHVERLREVGMRVCGEFDGPYSSVLFGAISETPTQSLNHIKAQVEEETILRCINFIKSNSDYDMHTTAINCAASELGMMIRKYKEQSDED